MVSADLQMGYSDGRDYTNGTRRNWEHGFLAQLLRHDYGYESIDGYAVHPYSQRYGPYQTVSRTNKRNSGCIKNSSSSATCSRARIA